MLTLSPILARVAAAFLFLTALLQQSPADDATPAAAPSTSRASTRRTFAVQDFGALPNTPGDSGNTLRAAIQSAIQSGSGAEVSLPPGVYRVKPLAPRGTCLPIHGATNLVIRGSGPGTRIVVTDPASSAFTLTGSQNVTLRDLTIDYDPLPFTQGTVRAVDVGEGWFDLDVDPGYPLPDAENFLRAVEPYGKWGMIMDRETRRIRSGTPDHYMTPRWEARTNRVWRFFTPEAHYRNNLRHMRVGDAYVHLARGHGSAMLAQGCDGVRIENVTVLASPGLVVGLVGNRGPLRVQGLQVRFASEGRRLLTANADGVHCQQNRSGPVIEDCYFEGMADDAINLYAPPNVLLEVRTPTQWLVSASAGILPNDRLQVLDPRSGRVRGIANVTSVAPDARGVLLTLAGGIEGVVAGPDHRSADTLYNLNACGAGFQIRRNHMNGNRRYGCLLRAGDGVVEDNVFADTTGAGVVLTNEPDWPEGPVPWNITVRNNRFLRGGTCLGYADTPQGAALAVRTSRLGGGVAQHPSIHDIRIEANEFIDPTGTAIFLGGAEQLTVRSNRTVSSTSEHPQSQGPAILQEATSNVDLADNTFGARPGEKR